MNQLWYGTLPGMFDMDMDLANEACVWNGFGFGLPCLLVVWIWIIGLLLVGYTVWGLWGQTTGYCIISTLCGDCADRPPGTGYWKVRHVEAVLTPCGGDLLEGMYAMWRLYTRHVEAVYVDCNGICVGDLLVCVCIMVALFNVRLCMCACCEW